MPPRIPAVFVFVALYFAAALGGGSESLQMQPPVGDGETAPTLAQILGFAAAAVALPDAAWRPARTALDRLVSWTTAALAVAPVLIEPSLYVTGYGVLLALAIGDGVASLGMRRQIKRKIHTAPC